MDWKERPPKREGGGPMTVSPLCSLKNETFSTKYEKGLTQKGRRSNLSERYWEVGKRGEREDGIKKRRSVPRVRELPE